MKNELLTVDQAAAELDITPQRLRQLIADKSLRAAAFGRQWQIQRADLAAVRKRPGRGRPRKIVTG